MTSPDYYQTIFDQAGDAIFIHDLNSTRIIDVNQAAELLTGFDKTELKTMDVNGISATMENFNLKSALTLINTH